MSDGAEQSKPTVVLPRADSIDGFQTDPASSPVAAGKPWVVLKFGGTSVSSGSTWKQIIARVKELREEMDCKIFLVLSALSQVLFYLGLRWVCAAARIVEEEQGRGWTGDIEGERGGREAGMQEGREREGEGAGWCLGGG
eukprot:3928817-Rhodomonas_salina.1